MSEAVVDETLDVFVFCVTGRNADQYHCSDEDDKCNADPATVGRSLPSLTRRCHLGCFFRNHKGILAHFSSGRAMTSA